MWKLWAANRLRHTPWQHRRQHRRLRQAKAPNQALRSAPPPIIKARSRQPFPEAAPRTTSHVGPAAPLWVIPTFSRALRTRIAVLAPRLRWRHWMSLGTIWKPSSAIPAAGHTLLQELPLAAQDSRIVRTIQWWETA